MYYNVLHTDTCEHEKKKIQKKMKRKEKKTRVILLDL